MNPLLRLALVGCLAILSIATQRAIAQSAADYPSKTVTIISPGTPSGGMDFVLRPYAVELEKRWKQNVIVDNRLGAVGMVATQAVARAPADGYTLLINADVTMGYSVLTTTGFDAEKQLTPIGILATAQQICIAASEAKGRTWPSLLAYAKANPKKLNFGTYLNTPSHLHLLRLMRAAGFEATLIPYNGQQAALKAVLANEIDATCTTTNGVAELAKSGRAYPFATMGRERINGFPEAPSFREMRIDFDWEQWFGLFAPVGTPPAIINKIRADLGELMKQPEMIAKIRSGGYEPEARSLAETSAVMWRGAALLRDTAQTVGFKPQ